MVAIPKLDRCLVMGVVNVTPDSFSDGGHWLSPQAAVGRGLSLVSDGADIVDVGGESTRPGATRVDAAEETRRVIPVVRELARSGVIVSIDTMRPAVAAAALEAGAAMVNDVSGGRADPDLLGVVAQARVPLVLMHWRAHSGVMQQHAEYDDVVAEVVAELRTCVAAAERAGIAAEDLIVDPGLGFAKLPDHNWTLLANLDALTRLGHPVLVGASRKRFLGELLDAGGGSRPAEDRDDATAAITALAAASGAWGVRVHEVRASADAVRVVARWARG